MAIEHVTPLWWWSQLSITAGALKRKADSALAVVMNQSAPQDAELRELRQLLDSAAQLLTRAEGGAAPTEETTSPVVPT